MKLPKQNSKFGCNPMLVGPVCLELNACAGLLRLTQTLQVGEKDWTVTIVNPEPSRGQASRGLTKTWL